jgi:hypothetical protein
MMAGLHVMMGKKKEVAATMERLLAATIQVKGEDHPDAARVCPLVFCLGHRTKALRGISAYHHASIQTNHHRASFLALSWPHTPFLVRVGS